MLALVYGYVFSLFWGAFQVDHFSLVKQKTKGFRKRKRLVCGIRNDQGYASKFNPNIIYLINGHRCLFLFLNEGVGWLLIRLDQDKYIQKVDKGSN